MNNVTEPVWLCSMRLRSDSTDTSISIGAIVSDETVHVLAMIPDWHVEDMSFNALEKTKLRKSKIAVPKLVVVK